MIRHDKDFQIGHFHQNINLFRLRVNSQNDFFSIEAHLEPCQISKMEFLARIVSGFQPLLATLAKSSTLDVWQGSEYASIFHLDTLLIHESWNLIVWSFLGYIFFGIFGS